MTTIAKNILNTYSKLFEGLDVASKKELISLLNKSLDKPEASKEKAFYESFGTFPGDETAEQLVEEIRSSRTFRQLDTNLFLYLQPKTLKP